MGDRDQGKVIAFDSLFTNNSIQKLKILASYMDRPMQKNIAIYIKYLELQYTMNFFRRFPAASITTLSHEERNDISKLCGEMLPYCDNSERSQIENMQNMFHTFEQYKEMMEMAEMMKDMFPEGENPINSMFSSGDLSQMFGSMDMSQMFHLFQSQGGDTHNE